MKKEVFNTRIRSDILKASKKLAIDLELTYAALFEEALILAIKHHHREDLIPKDSTQGKLF